MNSISNINYLPIPIIIVDLQSNKATSNLAFNEAYGFTVTNIETLNGRLAQQISPSISDKNNGYNTIKKQNNESVSILIASNVTDDQKAIISIQTVEPDFKFFFKNKSCVKLFSNLPLGIIIKHLESDETLLVSDYLITKIEYSFEEIAKNPWRVFTYKEDIAMQESLMNDKLKNGLNAVFFEKRVISKSGRIYWFSEYIRTFEHQNEHYQIIVMRDVSNEKEIETELQRAKQLVEDAERLKSAFLDNMPHEIRTPLHAITGFTSLLADPDLSNEERIEYVKFIQDSSNDILNLMDNIIEIAKLETNQIKPKREKCYVNSIIDKVYSDIISKQNILEKGHLTVNTIKENPDPMFTVVSDPERIHQILSHLLNNALKFTENGGVECGYRILNNSHIEFFVKDTGIGIAPEESKIIFKKFGKSGNINTNKNRGSGLGLTLSKKLVELLNGEISFESAKGKGSNFTFRIPIENEQKITISRPSVSGDIDWKSKTIMIVEDTDSNYFFIEAFLERTHASLLWAHNGVEAVVMFKENKVDLVLMDIMMPEMDGYEATRQIRAINQSIPVIAQTALALPDDEDKCYQSGCNYVLVKPISSEDLIATIKRFLQ
ncbi:MAG: ATP-binding protein [Prolixibacteraceae bacterium]|jgi:PAS domain S-box-containing protein|nr:ATP-binding protein [Prolixibacteraceae bacterium]